jgi:hypothetical protein
MGSAFVNLAELDLAFNRIGDANATRLVGHPGLPALKSLDVSGCDLTTAGVQRLRELAERAGLSVRAAYNERG